jgi:ferrous iron transport protein B
MEGSARATLRVALIGNPNCGKSTLFNALTGRNQKVANFPGVTVERVEGTYVHEGTAVSVLDLPGTYSLAGDAPDEMIALDVVHGRAPGVQMPDVFAVVLDAENIERNLYLATQVLELGRPTVIVLNRVDRLPAAGMSVDVVELIHALGAVVVPTVATVQEGIGRLRHAIARAPDLPPTPLRLRRPSGAQDAAARRYEWIADVMARTVSRTVRSGPRLSDRVDAVLLHRVWGPLIFLGVMALAFQALFTIAGPLAALLQSALGGVAAAGRSVLPAGDLRSLVLDGVLGGVGSVIVFVPQIALLFLFIGVLEDSGYLSRAAFVMDRFMRPLGLHGKSFIPLLSGYACAVPAILATRTIPQTRERLATIMVVPLMSCSARLPVYALLIAAFVPATTVGGVFTLQGIALLGMYLLGTGAALVSAAVFRRTILRSATRALIIEMPSYAMPTPRVLAAAVWQRVAVFLRRAGTVIFAISVLLWAMGHYPRAAGPATADAQLAQSTLGRVGHAVEPVVRPLGLDWKIGVAMVASFAAREVFVSTMGTMYAGAENGSDREALAKRLRNARADGSARPAYTVAAGMGLLVFYVFALMCTSTVAVTIRETGSGWRGVGWAALQFGYMLALAWGAGFVVYRVGLAIGLGVAA